jgi:uncharacterized membrane protein YsdA (DUF1294 family)
MPSILGNLFSQVGAELIGPRQWQTGETRLQQRQLLGGSLGTLVLMDDQLAHNCSHKRAK